MSQRDPNVRPLQRTIQALRERVADLEHAEADRRRAEGRLLEAQEAERRRLARELHDEFGQQLTCLRLLLDRLAAREAGPADAGWGEARGLLDGLLARVRALSADLRPALLDRLGLRAALLDLVERFTAQTGVRVEFREAGLERRFAGPVETAAYRIVQEGLTNAARHAGVAAAAVSVAAGPDGLSVRVEDRGAGFDPQAARASGRGFGLAGMHERVALLGGRLTIDSAPGRGTAVTAQLPLGGAGGAADA